MNILSILGAVNSIFTKQSVAAPVTPPTRASSYPAIPAAKTVFMRTPNFQTKQDRAIKYLILHSTGGTAASSISWMLNPDAKVSAHYLIDKSGTLYQFAEDKSITWHAGKSKWGTDDGLNSCSIGIELENLNDGVDTYSEIQIGVAVWLFKKLIDAHSIKLENVLRHLDVAIPAGRKVDPVNFPFSDFIYSLKQAMQNDK